jgi:hypothetical protein
MNRRRCIKRTTNEPRTLQLFELQSRDNEGTTAIAQSREMSQPLTAIRDACSF